MKRLYCLCSSKTSIYENLAIEEHLLTKVQRDSIILFLWQNSSCIVIGKNQNPWRECNIRLLNKDGISLARRKTGGGAVYHDLGNLNYSFICHEEDDNMGKQTEIVLDALRNCGIDAFKTGRNDLTDVEGRKISGSAFLQSGKRCLHHGTLMLDVDIDCMEKYLNVSREKLESKGVKSVKSRVVNLKEQQADITIIDLKEALKRSFGKIYNTQVEIMQEPQMKTIYPLVEFYQSYEWKYGREISFTWKIEERFSWGEIQIHFQVNGGIIWCCKIYTDTLLSEWNKGLEKSWKGKRFEINALKPELKENEKDTELEQQMKKDVRKLLENNL